MTPPNFAVWLLCREYPSLTEAERTHLESVLPVHIIGQVLEQRWKFISLGLARPFYPCDFMRAVLLQLHISASVQHFGIDPVIAQALEELAYNDACLPVAFWNFGLRLPVWRDGPYSTEDIMPFLQMSELDLRFLGSRQIEEVTWHCL